MRRTVIIATFLLLTAYALFAQTPLQVTKPGPEHQRLHYYVGDWKTEAEAKPGPFGPGGKFTVTNHNEMLGDFYVVFHGDGTGPTGPIKTLAAIGYDTKQKAYTSTSSPALESTLKRQAPWREILGSGPLTARQGENPSRDVSL